jgi:thiol-disulfide isomerase/thioredoxin
MTTRTIGTLAAAFLLALSACAGPGPGAASDKGVDVDTPTLRALRAEADIEPCAAAVSDPVEGGLPTVTLPCLGGGEDLTLSSLRGPMIVSLWASWCPNCVDEMPLFERFHQEYGDRVGLIGLDYQDPLPEAALHLMMETGATYPSFADPIGEVRVPFRVRGLPGIVFVRPDGTYSVRFTLIDDYDRLLELVRSELGVTLRSPGDR